MHSGASARHPEWDKDSKVARYHLSEAMEAYSDVGKVLCPYVDWDSQDSSTIKSEEHTVDEYRRAWEVAFGKLEDPKTQESIAKTVTHCKNEPRDEIPDSARWFGGSL
jgi:hypothetical protein